MLAERNEVGISMFFVIRLVGRVNEGGTREKESWSRTLTDSVPRRSTTPLRFPRLVRLTPLAVIGLVGLGAPTGECRGDAKSPWDHHREPRQPTESLG